MKIMILCHRLPYPPNHGGKIRPFNMIRHFALRHEVTVCTLVRTPGEEAAAQELGRYCQRVVGAPLSAAAGWFHFGLSTLTRYPATFGYFYSRRLARTVRQLLDTQRFDVVVVHSSSMGPYVAGHHGCPMIMDFADADSEKWLEYARGAPWPLSVGFALEGRKVRRYERWLGGQAHACTVVASRERDVMGAYISSPIHVIPNGVDLEYFQPQGQPGQRYVPGRLLFSGDMSYPPNVDAVEHVVADILPRVREEVPDVEFYIVGMNPSPRVRRLAEGSRVVVTGRVDDIRPYFDAAAGALAPLRVARGVQNKVLEAMAMRVPVVASPAAFQGISAVADRDLLVAGDAVAFSRAVVRLLREPATREAYARAGRACVEENHNWGILLTQLENLVGETATAPRALPDDDPGRAWRTVS